MNLWPVHRTLIEKLIPKPFPVTGEACTLAQINALTEGLGRGWYAYVQDGQAFDLTDTGWLLARLYFGAAEKMYVVASNRAPADLALCRNLRTAMCEAVRERMSSGAVPRDVVQAMVRKGGARILEQVGAHIFLHHDPCAERRLRRTNTIDWLSGVPCRCGYPLRAHSDTQFNDLGDPKCLFGAGYFLPDGAYVRVTRHSQQWGSL